MRTPELDVAPTTPEPIVKIIKAPSPGDPVSMESLERGGWMFGGLVTRGAGEIPQ